MKAKQQAHFREYTGYPIEHFMPHYIHVYIMKNTELILTKNIFPFAKGKPWTGKFDPWHIIP